LKNENFEIFMLFCSREISRGQNRKMPKKGPFTLKKWDFREMSISRKCARNGITSTAPLLRISIKKYNIFESGPFFDTVLRTGNLFGKNVRKTDPPLRDKGAIGLRKSRWGFFFPVFLSFLMKFPVPL
jgi:hypothetical protein